jgi:hypothetical protein
LGTQNTIKHTLNFRQKSKREKPEEFLVRAEPPNSDAVEPTFSWKLSFSKPVKTINKERVALSLDSTATTTLASYTGTLGKNDTELDTKITTKAKKFIRIKWQKDAFESILGDTVAVNTLTYPILDPEDFGLLRGRLTTTEPNYILELLDERQTVVRSLRNVPTYEFKNIKPGKYRLRLISDRNKNGKWDTGRYDQRLLPEPIQYYPTVITVKQNFELEGIDL